MNKAQWLDIKRNLEDADGDDISGVVKNVVSDIESLASAEQKDTIRQLRERIGNVDEDPRSWKNSLLAEMNNPRSPMWTENPRIQGDADGGPGGRRRKTRRSRKTRKGGKKTRATRKSRR